MSALEIIVVAVMLPICFCITALVTVKERKRTGILSAAADDLGKGTSYTDKKINRLMVYLTLGGAIVLLVTGIAERFVG